MQSTRTSASAGTRETLPDPVIHEFAPIARQLLDCESRPALLKSAGAEALAAEIEKTIEDSEPSVLSLDVFDTLLLRDAVSEARRFFNIAARARENVENAFGKRDWPTALDFLFARVDAMALCYRTREAVEGCREGKIGDIIRVARRTLDLPAEAESALLEAELDVETQSLTLNAILIDIVRDFRAAGGRVVLLSDMYLGKSEILSLVRRLDRSAAEEIDEVFSSADHIVSKRSGKIFALVEREFRKSPAEFLHIGDALEGDVFRARQAGWSALHFPIARAESAKRERDLATFIEEMSELGHDVTRWAKV